MVLRMGLLPVCAAAAALGLAPLPAAAHPPAFVQSYRRSTRAATGEAPLRLRPRPAPKIAVAPTPPLASKSEWNDLDDDDEFDDERPLPGPRDMAYLPTSVVRQNNNFVAIREAGGPELTNDVYARDPSTDVFFFVGKCARVSDVSVRAAVARQWPLIEEHACRLRRFELFPKRGTVELWTAPGDSELDVAYNRPELKFVKMDRTDDVEGARDVKSAEVGFQGEIYDQGEEGFRTWRTEDGSPKRDEIKAPEKGPKRAPTDEELEEIQELLKGKDLNEFFDGK